MPNLLLDGRKEVYYTHTHILTHTLSYILHYSLCLVELSTHTHLTIPLYTQTISGRIDKKQQLPLVRQFGRPKGPELKEINFSVHTLSATGGGRCLLLNHVYNYFLKTKLLTKSDPVTSFFRLYPRMCVDCLYKDMLVALFVLMKSWKQPKCSSSELKN